MEFERLYSAHEDVFGQAPESLLRAHWSQLDGSRPILDIGAGQGRHSLFLARCSLTVDALDPSLAAVEGLRAISAREGLPLATHQASFEEFAALRAPYGGVLAFGLIPILTWSQIERLAQKLVQWTEPGSLLFLTAFTTKDPGFAKHQEDWDLIGENSFRSRAGEVRTYLRPGQLGELLPAQEVEQTREYLGPPHRHGDGPVHRHAIAEALYRR
ncbi:MAG: class I SAM-dependent methyltransferase [Armatimonadetes bacterium]|nr:class I SAM-dependent methyltransferase [Armatimonadota bacterium]